MDKDQTGMITVMELQEALTSHGQDLTADEITQIVRNIDYAGNGKINYSEFLAATIEVPRVLTQDKLLALFKYFDTDNSGYITPANLREAFAKTGKTL
jgi:calcium-dependent protein kinase